MITTLKELGSIVATEKKPVQALKQGLCLY